MTLQPHLTHLSHASAVCRSWITDYSADAINLMLADLCYASDVELDAFFSDDRKHIKEGVVLVDVNMDNIKVPRVPPEVARAVVALPLTAEQRLKLAETEVRYFS